MNKVKKTRSLQSTLLKLVVSLAIIALILLLGLTMLGVTLIQNQIAQRQQFLINTLARQGDQYLDETDRFMQAIGNTITNLPPENRQQFLANSRKSYPRFSTLYLLDETGAVIVEDTDTTTLLGLDLSNAQYFKKGREAKQTFFSEPFISLATGNIAVTGAMPIYDKGQFMGMVVGELNLNQLQQVIEQVDLGEQGVSFIVDQRGALVAHPNQIWVQQQRNFHDLSIVQKGVAGERAFEIL